MIQPQDLVSFGSGFQLPDGSVTLRATPGPSVSLRLGTLAVADPWWPEALPESPVIAIGQGENPTLLSTIDVPRGERTETIACAAMIGPIEHVVTWLPLVQDEAHFHLDSDSALGAFYDVMDSRALRPLFEDAEHMRGVYNRALEEPIATLEVDGRVAAVVFLCPNGSGLYPAYAGFDEDMQAVAVLVDLRILGAAT